MEFELQGWKVKLALVALGLAVVVAPLAHAVASNKGRAEDWHRRAIAAEESVDGLRTVIAERSRALNERTIQANRLAGMVDSSGTALQRSKASVGTLARRQRELARRYARLSRERDMLRSRVATLERIGAQLSACAKAAKAANGAKDPRSSTDGTRTITAAQSRLEDCKRASVSFDTYLATSQ